MKINIKDLTESELIYLAEDLICILDCRARNYILLTHCLCRKKQ